VNTLSLSSESESICFSEAGADLEMLKGVLIVHVQGRRKELVVALAVHRGV